MWLIEQLGGSSDPACWGVSRDNYPKLPNQNDMARVPSRPAVEFLRDSKLSRTQFRCLLDTVIHVGFRIKAQLPPHPAKPLSLSLSQVLVL